MLIPSRVHPWWYYRYYAEIFGKSRDYEADLKILASCFELKNSIIQEIGAGTGNHVEAFLRHGTSYIEAIDIDPEAINLLSGRFYGDPRVSVIQCDGFSDHPLPRKCNLCVVFYCLVQQCRCTEVAMARVKQLITKTNLAGSSLAIELIDVDSHIKANPESKVSLIYRGMDGILEIKTIETSYGVDLHYYGTLLGRSVKYRVPLARINISDIEVMCDKLSGVPLGLSTKFFSESRRKHILCFRADGKITKS
jgi:SAM-dependent methyltransferase